MKFSKTPSNTVGAQSLGRFEDEWAVFCAFSARGLASYKKRFIRMNQKKTASNDLVSVKAGSRTQAKFMQQFIRKYKPEEAVIISARHPSQKPAGVIRYVPLCLAGSV